MRGASCAHSEEWVATPGVCGCSCAHIRPVGGGPVCLYTLAFLPLLAGFRPIFLRCVLHLSGALHVHHHHINHRPRLHHHPTNHRPHLHLNFIILILIIVFNFFNLILIIFSCTLLRYSCYFSLNTFTHCGHTSSSLRCSPPVITLVTIHLS